MTQDAGKRKHQQDVELGESNVPLPQSLSREVDRNVHAPARPLPLPSFIRYHPRSFNGTGIVNSSTFSLALPLPAGIPLRFPASMGWGTRPIPVI